MRNPTPAWWLLYAVLAIAVTLLVAADLASPLDCWGEIAEGMVVLLVSVAIALWLRANRAGLVLMDLSDGEDKRVARWMIHPDPILGSSSTQASSRNEAAGASIGPEW